MPQLGTDGSYFAIRDPELGRIEVRVHSHPEDGIVEASALRREGSVLCARFGEDAADLLSAGEQVVGPLDAGLDPDLPKRLRNTDRRGLRDARSETRVEPATQHKRYPEPTLRRSPRPPEPSPSPGLDLRDDERPLRCSSVGQLTGALLGRAQRPMYLDDTRERAFQGLNSLRRETVHRNPNSSMVAISLSVRAAACTSGTASRPPVPSPRRMSRSRSASSSRHSRTIRAPASAERWPAMTYPTECDARARATSAAEFETTPSRRTGTP